MYAANQMGVSPDKCLVIEDSLTGVRAGISAKMDVWGYIGASHDPKAAEIILKKEGACHIFDNFIHMHEKLKL